MDPFSAEQRPGKLITSVTLQPPVQESRNTIQQAQELEVVLVCERWHLTYHHKARLGDTYLLQSS